MARRRAISLFSNCGAGDVGYREAGFRFDVMAEKDERRLDVCILNHPGAQKVPGDLRDTWRTVVTKYRQRAGSRRPALLAACPPCQGMSSAKYDRGRGSDPDAGSKDERNLLVQVIVNVATALHPAIIVVENVQEFFTRQIRHPFTEEGISAARYLIEELQDRYQPFPILTNLCDYGVPQNRKRAFLTFARRDLPGLRRFLVEGRAPFPRPTHCKEYGGPSPISLAEALRGFNLPVLDATSRETARSTEGGGLHQVPVWSEQRYQMVAAIPPDTGRSAWENNRCGTCGDVEVGESDALCPNCGSPLLRPVIKDKDSGVFRLITGFKSSSYRRMLPNRPAPTVTTASGHVGSNITIHPAANRLLSVYECALLQTFPTDFKWGTALKDYGTTPVREMIGEAVPPLFTKLHGSVLMDLLGNKQGQVVSIASSDKRCASARTKLDVPLPVPLRRGRKKRTASGNLAASVRLQQELALEHFHGAPGAVREESRPPAA